MQRCVLIVDDEPNILLTVSQSLELDGYRCELASNGLVALDVVTKKPVDCVLMDVQMPDIDGIEMIDRLRAIRPELPIIMMSGHASIERAVKATQLGACDFLEKPLSRDRLLLALHNTIAHQRTVEELTELRSEVGRFDMVGQSLAMQQIYRLIARTAPTDGRVLITGENGTGKELVARAIHTNSKRRSEKFVKLNCAAVPHELIESELFGHEKGAFTGALAARRGKFEQAHQGTIFLDEVADMPAAMQAKLLRVLQEGEFERVGGSETIAVDVRVLSATNKNLQQEIAAGRFREDLYFRLNVIPIHVPPLRSRPDDLPALIDAFLEEVCRKNSRKRLRIEPGAIARMLRYDYPGNIRELHNLIERLAILCPGPTVTGHEAEILLPKAQSIAASPIPAPTQPAVLFRAGKTFHDQVDDAEREIILGALAYTHDNATDAAKLLDLERGHFYKKMKALGIKRAGGETFADASEATTSSGNSPRSKP